MFESIDSDVKNGLAMVFSIALLMIVMGFLVDLAAEPTPVEAKIRALSKCMSIIGMTEAGCIKMIEEEMNETKRDNR